MGDVAMEHTRQQCCDEIEIDLSRYLKVIAKRKKVFIWVFLLVFVPGFGRIVFSPKMYRISMLIQPPVSGESLTGASDLESAENLKGLIVNNAFSEAIISKLNLDPDKDRLEFNVTIPSKTNILQVGIDLESKKRELGLTILQNLIETISQTYAKRIEARTNEINDQIKRSERSIANTKEKAKNLQDQINEISARQDKLIEEIKTINANTGHILEKREELLKSRISSGSMSLLILANFIQNNLSYLNQLNNQFSDLSIRRDNLSLEIKNTDSQISDYEQTIDKLNAAKVFISNLRVVSHPRIPLHPIRERKIKLFAFSALMGLLSGVLGVFLYESWTNTRKNIPKQK
ncbi:MAG TPA: Wzz/FepE/Etk N-terminal domain-containing protein [Patescibacteria group bacterium]|nr:Wzz/FepE/Etk N-terminal domain-containing protein [Patescibacteria group bacterium]